MKQFRLLLTKEWTVSIPAPILFAIPRTLIRIYAMFIRLIYGSSSNVASCRDLNMAWIVLVPKHWPKHVLKRLKWSRRSCLTHKTYVSFQLHIYEHKCMHSFHFSSNWFFLSSKPIDFDSCSCSIFTNSQVPTSHVCMCTCNKPTCWWYLKYVCRYRMWYIFMLLVM